MIMLFISFDGLSYTVPVNPKDLTISQASSNANIDIIGLGKATRKGEPGLRTLRLNSFFPNPKSRYYMNIPASTYIEFIQKIWNTENINNKVAHISSYGVKDDIAGAELDMYFVIEKFDYTYRGGDFDTEYSLSIKEYKPYGVKVIENNFTEGMQSARAPSTVKENTPGLMEDTQPTTEAKTYSVSSGDTLWSIAKRATGDGNNWRALYEANKDVIGSNPNMLRAGTVLTLPENWNSPTARVNTNTSAKIKVSSGIKVGTLTNATAVNNVNITKETVTNKSADTSLGSDKWIENNQRVMELYYFEQQYKQHISELDKVYNKLSSVNTLGLYGTDLAEVKRTKTKLQNAYDNAVKKASDSTKSEQERVKAIQDARAAELSMYNKSIVKHEADYTRISTAPIQKFVK